MTSTKNLSTFIITTAAILIATASAAGIYTSAWGKIAAGTDAIANATLLSNTAGGTRRSSLEALAAGSLSFLIDFAAWTPAELNTTDIVSVPFGAAGVCAAYAVGTSSSIELTVDQLLGLLRGDQPAFALPVATTTSISSAAITLVLAADTAVLGPVASTAAASGLASASLTAGFEAAVRANPRVQWVATADAAVAATAAGNATHPRLTLTSVVDAVSRGVPCFALKVPHPKFTAQGLVVGALPVVGAAGTALRVSLGDGASVPDVVTQQGSTEPAYPLVVPCALLVSRPYAEAAMSRGEAAVASEWARALVGLLDVGERLSQWSMALIPGFDANRIVARALDAVPSDIAVVRSRGSSAVQELVSAWSLQYLRLSANPRVFVAYGGGGSGGGLRAIKGDTHLLAGSDARFSDADYAAYPGVQFAPATAFAVSLAFNLPGAVALTLPRCVAVSIFVGAVKYWDDPEIVRYNPTLLLPHAEIVVFVRSTKSGTTSIFTEGLVRMDAVCQGSAAAARLNMTSTWTTNTFPGFTNVREVPSTSDVIAGVLATPYSIGYGSASSVRIAGGFEAQLVDEVTESAVGPTVVSVQEALATATLDPARLTVDFALAAAAYPFAGVTYFVFRSSRSGNATTMRHALRFLEWAYMNAEAQVRQRALDFVPVPESIAVPAIAAIRAVQADGQFLMPQPAAADDESGLSSAVVAVIALIAVLLLAGIGFALLAVRGKGGKDNSCAPRGADRPVTIMFTDIQSSTSLWARCPSAMGPALDAHNDIIRRLIAKHRAYEVKTIGDAFMIAVGSTATALKLAVDIQRELHDAEWNPEINATYAELACEPWVSSATPEIPAITVKDAAAEEKWWNGIRVRVGIATGAASWTEDPISGGIDYHGSVVNLASRVESAGHGGQILLERATMNQLEEDVGAWETTTVTPIGHHLLKGFDEPFELIQVLPRELNKRTFPAPRTDQAMDADEDDESYTTTASQSLKSGMTGGSSASRYSKNQHLLDGVSTAHFFETVLSPLAQSEREKITKTIAQAWRVRYTGKVHDAGARAIVKRATAAANRAAGAAAFHQAADVMSLSSQSASIGIHNSGQWSPSHAAQRYVISHSNSPTSEVL